MDAISFTMINAACLIALIILLHAQRKMRDKSMPALLLVALLYAAMALTVLDLAGGLVRLNVPQDLGIPMPYGLNAADSVLVYMFITGCCYLAFLYAEAEMGRAWLGSRKKLALSAVPLAVFWLVLFVPRDGQLFYYLNNEGMLVRSSPLLLTGSFLYLFALTGHCSWAIGHKNEETPKEKLRALLMFSMGTLAGTLLQLWLPGRGLLCTGLTLSLIEVYVVIQQNKITVDALTGISNRAVLLRYLESELPYYRRHPNKSLYFLMMDLDRFKHINDEYGHLEGDAALVLLARTLKKVCANYNCVLARYGGDEFCIACGCDIVGVRTLIASIKRELIAANEASGKPYQIEISIGCAKLKPEIATVHDLIDKADQEMYLLKTRKKGTAKTEELR